MLIAEEIHPLLSPSEYMDKKGFENEIKQVIGDTQAVYALSDDELLFDGTDGVSSVCVCESMR